jgi:hypothetical protein
MGFISIIYFTITITLSFAQPDKNWAGKFKSSQKDLKTAITINGLDKLVSAAKSKNKVVALSQLGRIYVKHADATDPQYVRVVRKEMGVTTPAVNFKGKVDCWGHLDACIICGPGGCYVIAWSSSGGSEVHTIPGVYFQKSFSVGNIFNYVYAASVIDNTAYFLAVESMKGKSSPGLIRYKYPDTGNCFLRYSGELASDSSPPIYYISEFGWTTKVAVLEMSTKLMMLVDYTTMKAVFKPTAFPSGEAVGPIAASSKDPLRNIFVSCQQNSDLLCSLMEYSNNAYKLLARYKQTKNANKPSSSDPISVTFLPASDYFAVSFGKFVHFFEAKYSATDSSKTAVQENYYMQFTTNIIQVKDSYYYKDMLFASDTKVWSGLLKNEETGENAKYYKCSDACGGAVTSCGNNFLRNADCTATCVSALKSSGFSQGIKCAPNVATTSQSKVVPKYISDFSKITWDDKSATCTNKTLIPTTAVDPKKNPNMNTTSSAKSPSSKKKASKRKIWLIILIIAAVLGIAGAVVFLLTKKKDPLAAEKKSVAAAQKKLMQKIMKGEQVQPQEMMQLMQMKQQLEQKEQMQKMMNGQNGMGMNGMGMNDMGGMNDMNDMNDMNGMNGMNKMGKMKGDNMNGMGGMGNNNGMNDMLGMDSMNNWNMDEIYYGNGNEYNHQMEAPEMGGEQDMEVFDLNKFDAYGMVEGSTVYNNMTEFNNDAHFDATPYEHSPDGKFSLQY